MCIWNQFTLTWVLLAVEMSCYNSQCFYNRLFYIFEHTYVRSSSIVFVYALLTQISKAICNECWCCLSSWWACCVIRIASSHVNWRAISVCGVYASMYCMYGEFNKRYLDASRRYDSNSIDISSHNWILHNFRLSHTTLLNEYRQVSTK